MTRTPTYCQTSDISSRLRLSSNGVRTVFSSSTDPTDAEVQDRIFAFEDYINQYCNDAWFITSAPLQTYNTDSLWMGWRPYELAIPLNYAHIQDLSEAQGDVFNVRQGNTWIDMLDGTHTEGMGGDYYLDLENGIVYLCNYRPVFGPWQIQVQCRYGASAVPYDIKRACTNLVAADILESDFQTVTISAGEGFQTDRYKTSARWRAEAEELMSRHRRAYITPTL